MNFSYFRFHIGEYDNPFLETNGGILEFSIQGKTTIVQTGEDERRIDGLVNKTNTLKSNQYSNPKEQLNTQYQILLPRRKGFTSDM